MAPATKATTQRTEPATVVVGVSELLLAKNTKKARVRVELPDGLATAQQTPAIDMQGGNRSVRVDWSISIPIQPGGSAWTALEAALERRAQPEAAAIRFTVLDESTGVIGDAVVDLSRLAEYGRYDKESPKMTLNVVDKRGVAHGQLIAHVQALEAVRLVLKGAPSPPPPLPLSIEPKVKKAFETFDKNGDGSIDADELREALKYLGLNASAAQTREVLERYDTGFRDGKLDLGEFARLVQDLNSFTGGGGIEPKVKKAFETFDKNGDGSIDADELREALKYLGLNASAAQTREVLERYDTGFRDGKLDLGEFARLVQDLNSFTGGGGIEPKVKKAFETFDKNGDGSIDADELREALKYLGLNASAAQTREVLERYDTGFRDGKLDLGEFARLVQDLNSFTGGGGIEPKVKKAFETFDKNGDGSIDADELREALKYLGLNASAAQTREVLERYDTGFRDGKLDLGEFARLVQDLNSFTGGGGALDGGMGTADERVRVAFSRFDVDGNGRLDAVEIKQALATLGMVASSSEAVAVLQKYDTDRSGGVELAEFAQLVNDLIAFQGGGSKDIPHEVRKAFAHFDSDGNGRIDAFELRTALHHLGVEASSAQALAVLKKYDVDRSRELDIDEFAKLVMDVREFQKGVSRDKVLEQLKLPQVVMLLNRHRTALDELFSAFARRDETFVLASGLAHTDEELRAAFATFDPEGSGAIDAKALGGALARLGVPTNGEQAERVLARYQPGSGSSMVGLSEFRALVADLRRFATAAAPEPSAAKGGAVLSEATSRMLGVEELLSMCHGFRLVPDRLREEEVKTAVREMQPSSTAVGQLQPFKRLFFDEVLLRMAHVVASRTGGVQSAEPHVRLEELFQFMRLDTVAAMRMLMRTHMLIEACTSGELAQVRHPDDI